MDVWEVRRGSPVSFPFVLSLSQVTTHTSGCTLSPIHPPGRPRPGYDAYPDAETRGDHDRTAERRSRGRCHAHMTKVHSHIQRGVLAEIRTRVPPRWPVCRTRTGLPFSMWLQYGSALLCPSTWVCATYGFAVVCSDPDKVHPKGTRWGRMLRNHMTPGGWI